MNGERVRAHRGLRVGCVRRSNVEAMIAIRFRPHSRPLVAPFYQALMELEETLSVTHVSGADDFLLHIAVPDIAHLRDFILDRLTTRAEIAFVQTMVVFEQRHRHVITAAADGASSTGSPST